MKIAVTYENGNVFQHFGHTRQFKLYEVENGAIQSERILEGDGAGHGALAGQLGQAGVDDAAAEVRALRRKGVRVSAVFMGETASIPAAERIYGKDLARIRGMDQLARAAGRLIQNEIRALGD